MLRVPPMLGVPLSLEFKWNEFMQRPFSILVPEYIQTSIQAPVRYGMDLNMANVAFFHNYEQIAS